MHHENPFQHSVESPTNLETLISFSWTPKEGAGRLADIRSQGVSGWFKPRYNCEADKTAPQTLSKTWGLRESLEVNKIRHLTPDNLHVGGTRSLA